MIKLSSRAKAALALVFASATLFAQDLPQSDLSIERLNSYPLVQGRSPSAPAMSHEGGKIAFGWNLTGDRKLDLYVTDFPNGKPKRIVEAVSIKDLPRQDDSRTDLEKKEADLYDGGIGGAEWSPDDKELMFSYKGRVWLVSPDGSNLRTIFDGASGIGAIKYTEDGKSMSYSNGQNVFLRDRKTGVTKQLTFISKANTSIDDYQFSPDGKWIVVQWSDSSKTGNYQMMDFSKDRATVVPIKRDWNGDLSQDNQIGIVSADGGLIKFVADIPHYSWIKNVTWSPDSKKVEVGWFKDDFKEYTIAVVDPTTAVKKDVYHEVAPRYTLNDWRDATWSRDSKRILFGTDIHDNHFINRSVFSMNADGSDIQPVYMKLHDVGGFMRPKDSDRLILVTAARSPLTTEIRVLEPNGKETVHVVMKDGYSTPKAFNWAELPLISDDGKKMATLASERKLNPELYAVEPVEKRMTESQTADYKKVQWADIKEVTFKSPDGREIHGLMYTKPGLDMSKKHPALLSNIYADSGKAAWAGFMENYAAMNLDMVVLSVDFRSSWGYDGDFNASYYRSMGIVDADEAVSAKNFLASLPYVRGDRVGIWGWSYGGFLTCMTMLTKPGEFYAGVAVASVTDWKSYNEWYTRRRLGLVKDDKEWFDKCSPITYADGLKGNLLLVHGILDDNVLFQDTARLVQRMIDAGKHPDIMFYPRDNHSIGKDTSRPHVMATIMRYLYNKLNQ
ncbi:MAG: prolyl oligopeptidase family serine peptidase [Armatimonadetes bacterium]|nr:prolyl oligopeptidase family serine peptidase [Armatimonadota bacterium]